MELRKATAAGLFVEFRDSLGNSAGSAVYFDWQGRALPAVGDQFACSVHSPRARTPRRMAGRVTHRAFDVQTDDAGKPCVWVRLVVDVGVDCAPAVNKRGRAGFEVSRN
ncbi:MAG: hypothetical protein K1X71_02135 [Pirellulales bacterium]|jgi:hypothetical protein|nr:hypothetical protein [Pirellulales bacterium]